MGTEDKEEPQIHNDCGIDKPLERDVLLLYNGNVFNLSKLSQKHGITIPKMEAIVRDIMFDHGKQELLCQKYKNDWRK